MDVRSRGSSGEAGPVSDTVSRSPFSVTVMKPTPADGVGVGASLLPSSVAVYVIVAANDDATGSRNRIPSTRRTFLMSKYLCGGR